MAKYGIFENGTPRGFYADDVNPVIPAEAVEISHADWQKYLTGQYYRAGDGTCTPNPADLGKSIAGKLARINEALRAYIESSYDIGTQSSMQALYSRAATPAQAKGKIDAVWNWVQSVLEYYYQCKTEISALIDAAAVDAYAWDFSQFDATQPAVSLGSIFEDLKA